MKTKILILALTNAFLSFGNLSQAQDRAPLSAENKSATIQSTTSFNTGNSARENEKPIQTASTDSVQSPEDAQLHSQVALKFQQFVESRELDEKICSDSPQDCDYGTSFIVPAIVY